MKKPLIYVQDPNALRNWLCASDTEAKVLYDLVDLPKQFEPSEYILLIQLTPSSDLQTVIELSKLYDTIVTANEPNDAEGLALFQNGVKGYINTFSTVERIKQALETVQSGNVWLGQSIMQAMIQAIMPQPAENDSWKERLTERELQTAELVLKSLSNKEIARELSITERTVKAHLHNIFEKFNVNDRLSLVLRIKSWQ